MDPEEYFSTAEFKALPFRRRLLIRVQVALVTLFC